ncbi:deoxyuridine triphosphatase [Microbacterium phage Katzastrophic]|uniref:deoxyuridine triphosphatase n=1 Tax=Microbacterium phage Katzastrophic TaxID=2912654 RepID=UPI00242B9EC9|nr:deoxyuridine triphosphatase [Microbacterium phage Katzastrophic]UKH48466.1 deoxyuridine triphosphatase [Microbacterium phage Katzastrophic]
MTDTLQELLDAQSALQEKMPTPHPSSLFRDLVDLDAPDAGGVTEFIQWNHKALLHEMVELESETGWKPWATKRFVNLEAARGEAIDMLHFLLNDFLVLGLDADEVRRRYHAKHAKNVKRQEDGYDGVSTKCPGCHRALDDDAVECRPTTQRLGANTFDGVYCAVRGRFLPTSIAGQTSTHQEGSFS